MKRLYRQRVQVDWAVAKMVLERIPSRRGQVSSNSIPTAAHRSLAQGCSGLAREETTTTLAPAGVRS